MTQKKSSARLNSSSDKRINKDIKRTDIKSVLFLRFTVTALGKFL